ncbi:MAG: ParB N-terminal domain-containing protein [Deltaproteobacteria bacterium]|nr:ParB N-terminal domain-containing protein [Deltaproteobacteria bacterium]
MKKSHGVVSLTEIDFAERSFPFSWGPGSDALADSLAAVGVLQPPLLTEGDNGFRIVCGRRRLEYLRERTDATSVLVTALVEDGAEAELFRLALWENRAIREFNLVETADIYLAAEKLFPAARLEGEIMPVLALPRRPRFIKRCRIIASFPEGLRALTAAGAVDGETVDLLGEWSPEACQALLELVAVSGLRRNKLREVVGRIDDLARRDGCAPTESLAAAVKVARVPEAEKVDGEVLRDYLKCALYPNLTKARRDFAARLEKLSWPARLQLEPPPDFEGGDYRLSFTFNGVREWREALQKLAALTGENVNEICRRP